MSIAVYLDFVCFTQTPVYSIPLPAYSHSHVQPDFVVNNRTKVALITNPYPHALLHGLPPILQSAPNLPLRHVNDPEFQRESC